MTKRRNGFLQRHKLKPIPQLLQPTKPTGDGDAAFALRLQYAVDRVWQDVASEAAAPAPKNAVDDGSEAASQDKTDDSDA